MSRSLSALSFAIRLSALAAATLLSSLVCAADPAHRLMRLGFVGALSPSAYDFTPFWQRLRELGWVEGQNLIVERRSAEGNLERLPALMADVLDREVDVLATYGQPAAIAAKKATTTIPIVAWAIADPVGSGLVASFARPGGNLTGLSTAMEEGLSGKWLELLQEAVPRLNTVAAIVNPDNSVGWALAKELEAAASTRGLKVQTIELRTAQGLDRGFEAARSKAQAVVNLGEPITVEHRARVIALAAKRRLPAIYFMRVYVDAGGLMSYGPDYAGMIRRGAEYVDKILRGTKPADLPIEQSSRFALVVNLKTAKALRLTIPESILVRADEVIR